MNSEHTKGKIEFGKTSEPILIVGGESKQYIANVRLHQTGGGVIASAMEEIRQANAERLVLCWNSHDALLEACKAMVKDEPFGITPYFDEAMEKVKQAIAQAEAKND